MMYLVFHVCSHSAHQQATVRIRSSDMIANTLRYCQFVAWYIKISRIKHISISLTLAKKQKFKSVYWMVFIEYLEISLRANGWWYITLLVRFSNGAFQKKIYSLPCCGYQWKFPEGLSKILIKIQKSNRGGWKEEKISIEDFPK